MDDLRELELEPLKDQGHGLGGGEEGFLELTDQATGPADEDAKATDEELLEAEQVAKAIDKPSNPKRWFVLVLATIAIFGPYYVFDNPAGTQHTVSASRSGSWPLLGERGQAPRGARGPCRKIPAAAWCSPPLTPCALPPPAGCPHPEASALALRRSSRSTSTSP